ncbi:hypothetical protein SAY87_012614 [Trapa incisa]|uniref:Uncharacterized protein n=1 Tax=Trapa incisa TaxID=236973 RepID=A0AAN7JJK1_9MYRT|nr:hypothetical protein SAY87_012614 [Trapa incisa]
MFKLIASSELLASAPVSLLSSSTGSNGEDSKKESSNASSSSSNSPPYPPTVSSTRIGDEEEDPGSNEEVPEEDVPLESNADFWNRLDNLGDSSPLHEFDLLLDLGGHLDAKLRDQESITKRLQ